MRTFADLLCGGGGFALGAIAAGYTHAWGIEYDNDIADCYKRNIGHVIRARVQDVDFSQLPQVYHLHMSPICTNASQAKAGGKESAEDISIADSCARAIREMRPVTVSLENVWPYRHFESFGRILRALDETSYTFKFWHLNAADYGVPQTRKRLILLANRSGPVHKPVPTHVDFAKTVQGQAELFGGNKKRWVSWYQAVEDILDTLPESRFADWQIKRLPEEIKGSFLNSTAGGGNTSREATVRFANEPSATITADDYRRPSTCPRAFIVRPTDQLESVTGGNTMHGRVKAFVVDQQNGSRDSTVKNDSEPIFTLTHYSTKHPAPRAWLSQGRVVAMNPRALARFMSIPDSYHLPDKSSLACKIIGNAVCPLQMERMLTWA